MSPTSYDLWLAALREDDESLPSIDEQNAFLDFLNQKTTAEEAALAYTYNVTNAKIQDPESLWILIWKAAQEWPETHQRLIDLLKAITRLPPITQEMNAGEGSKSEYWKELPCFEFYLREYWDGKVTRVTYNADLKLHADFINLTSFNAHLFREDVFQLEVWAIVTLSIALENDYGSQPHLLDTFILAAAQYILQAGPAVYKCDKEATFPGPLLEKVREGGAVERWAFWKERFALVRDRGDLKENTRAVGEQAVQCMEKVEKDSH